MTTRRTCSTEFKREAVALVQTSGMTMAEVERNLGLTVGLLKHWLRDAKRVGAEAFPGHGRLAAIEGLKKQFPGAMQKCLAYFLGVDRTLDGYEGLIAAPACLPNNERRDAFAAEYGFLSGTGGLLWHALGAKTVEIIHENVHVYAVRDDLDENVHVYAVRDDLDEIVLDPDLLEAVLGSPDHGKKAKEIEFKLTQRLRNHLNNPRYRKLSERLEALKACHKAGQLHSIEFLKLLLDLARDWVEAEKETPAVEDEDRDLISSYIRTRCSLRRHMGMCGSTTKALLFVNPPHSLNHDLLHRFRLSNPHRHRQRRDPGLALHR